MPALEANLPTIKVVHLIESTEIVKIRKMLSQHFSSRV